MKTKLSPGPILLVGAMLAAVAAPLDASPRPPRDTASSTRPSSAPSGGSSGSSGVASRSGGSRSSGTQAVSRAPSSTRSPRHGAGATRPPAGSGGVVERGERRGGGGGGIVHPRWWDNHWYFGFGLGHPWGYYWGPYSWHRYGWWGGPWYGYGPGYGYGYGYGHDRPRVRYQEPGAIDLDVKPKRTEVYVDGSLVGSVGQFDGFPDYLWLTPGTHEIVLYRDGYVTQRRVVEIRPAWVIDLRVALADGETLPPDQVSRPVEGAGGTDRDQGWRERD